MVIILNFVDQSTGILDLTRNKADLTMNLTRNKADLTMDLISILKAMHTIRVRVTYIICTIYPLGINPI